jgi:DNA-directed RNA polymerase sigma subunit (sigma70/sigma32)
MVLNKFTSGSMKKPIECDWQTLQEDSFCTVSKYMKMAMEFVDDLSSDREISEEGKISLVKILVDRSCSQSEAIMKYAESQDKNKILDCLAEQVISYVDVYVAQSREKIMEMAESYANIVLKKQNYPNPPSDSA